MAPNEARKRGRWAVKWWALRAAPVPAWVAVTLGALCVLIGSLLATPDEPPVSESTPTSTVAQITDESVTRLAQALEAVTSSSSTVPSDASPAVSAAQAVLDAVDRGQVQVAPPATAPPPSTTTTTSPPTTAEPGSRENPVDFPDPPPTSPFPPSTVGP